LFDRLTKEYETKKIIKIYTADFSLIGNINHYFSSKICKYFGKEHQSKPFLFNAKLPNRKKDCSTAILRRG